MKKLLLSVVFAMVALATTFAAQLNPFAYGLSAELSNDQSSITFKFYLNADAESVKVIVNDGENDYIMCDYGETKMHSSGFTATRSTADLPQGKQLTWRVDVTGTSVQSPTQVKQYSFYHPRSIDIDNNPENENFGTIFVIEALNNLHSSNSPVDKYSSYLSYKCGAGLYVFNPAFENLPTPNNTPGYNGGKEYTVGYWTGEMSYYSPNRVRVSEDGRIFITSCDPSGQGYLWEADKYTFSKNKPVGWTSSSWAKVLQGTRDTKTEQMLAAGGTVVAAPNISMDVKGTGDDLQVLLLSGTKSAIVSSVLNDYALSEYDLGESTTWNTAPSRILTNQKQVVAYNFTQIEYDQSGGYWLCQRRESASSAGTNYASLMHVNASGVVDLKDVSYYRGAGAIRLNHDNTKLIVAGKTSQSSIQGTSNVTTSGDNGAYATIYSISITNTGAPKLTRETQLNLSPLGKRITDFAWDYAGNLYAGCYNSEILAVWAMPYSGEVSTPAAEKYAFTLDCKEGTQYEVQLSCDNAVGFVTGGGMYNSCTEATISASLKTNDYRFVRWSNGVTENPYTFTVRGNTSLIAEFEQVNPIPCVIAYDLTCTPNYSERTHNFSFYANTKPTIGKIVFYNEGKIKLGEYLISQDLAQGYNLVKVPNNQIPQSDTGSDIVWELELTAPDNDMIAEIYNEGDKGHNLLHMAIDNNPKSDFFGRIYMENSIARSNTPRGYFYIYDYAYNLVEKIETGQKGNTLGYYGRPAVDKEGWVYWSDLDYTHGGIFTMNPYTLETSPFFTYTSRNTTTGVLTNGSVVVGSSYSTCDIYGEGKDTKLYTINHNASGTLKQDGLAIYDIGQNDGSIKRTNWGEAPSKTIAISKAGNYFFSVVVSSRGTWVTTHRTKATSDYVVLQFYDSNGVQRYVSTADVLKGNRGAGLAVSDDEKQLAIAALNKVDDANEYLYIKLFDISWSGNVPTLTLTREYKTIYRVIPSMQFDYAGNLLVTAGISSSGYNVGAQNDPTNQANNKHRLVTYTMPKSPNKISVPARYSQRISGLLIDERENVEPIAKQMTYTTASVYRPLQSEMYNTICLPFNLTTLVGSPYEGASVLKFERTNINDDVLELHFNTLNVSEETPLMAGVPYLIKPNNEIVSSVDFFDVTTPIIENPNEYGGKDVEGGDLTFHGIMNPTSIVANSNILMLVAENRLAEPSADGEMLGLRGFFTVNGPLQLPKQAIIVIQQSTPTSIPVAPEAEQQLKPEVRKVMYDGKIYILRGDEVYTITGHRVK